MLTFKEKRSLQKIVQVKLEELSRTNLSFKEKRTLQKELSQALEKLTNTKPASATPLLDALVAGKHDHEPPLRFLSRVEAVVKELGGEFEPVKEPMATYATKKLAA